jgi:hypothetical protein
MIHITNSWSDVTWIIISTAENVSEDTCSVQKSREKWQLYPFNRQCSMSSSTVSLDSSVGIMTRLRAGQQRNCVSIYIFFFFKTFRPSLRPIQFPTECVPVGRSPGEESEADHSPPSSEEVKNQRNCTSIPPMPSLRVHGLHLCHHLAAQCKRSYRYHQLCCDGVTLRAIYEQVRALPRQRPYIIARCEVTGRFALQNTVFAAFLACIK